MRHLRPGLLLLPALAALAGCSLLGSDLEPGGDAVRADTPATPAALDGATSTWEGELQLPDGLLSVSAVTPRTGLKVRSFPRPLRRITRSSSSSPSSVGPPASPQPKATSWRKPMAADLPSTQ